MLWGTTNHVYVTETKMSTALRGGLGKSGLIRWIVEHVQSSFPECMGILQKDGSPTQRVLERKTRIFVYGLVDRTPGTSKEVSDAALGAWKEALWVDCCNKINRSVEFWKTVMTLGTA